ncbi:MAG: radical SAM protein [Pseudonocardiaceae bacterium]
MTSVNFLELEITGKCGLRCAHCYAESSPRGDHSPMAVVDWERVIDDAKTAGIGTVQFIGGEPTLHPDLPRLVRYALAIGLNADVYTNLVHVTAPFWELFSLPGVSLGTSWYSANPDYHAEITGSRYSYYRTRANIAEAVRRSITIRAGIVHVRDGQDIDAARGELLALGVTDINTDHARPVGRASHGREPTTADLCGQCGNGRAAIGPDGTIHPCVLGRFLNAGNVNEQSLTDILDGSRWRDILASIPTRDTCVTCTPADSNDCDPSRKPRMAR